MGKVKSGGQSDFSGDFCSKIGKFDTSTETQTYFVNFYEKNTSTIKEIVSVEVFKKYIQKLSDDISDSSSSSNSVSSGSSSASIVILTFSTKTS